MAGSRPRSEQGAQDRGIDLRPVERGGFQGRFDLGACQRQGVVAVEEAAVEPCDGFETDAAACSHGAEELAGHGGKVFGPAAGMFQHAGKHIVGQQADVFGEHAEDEAVDEMGDLLRVVAAGPQGLRQRGEGGSGALGQGLAALTGTQPFRIRHGPLEFVTHGCVGQIFKRELVNDADAVGPVGVNAEARHVGDDQQGRVFQRQRVLAQLVEGGVQVFVLALVLPGEAVPSPDIGPTAAAGVLAGAALKAVALPARIVLRGRRLAQQPAEVDEMLVRGGTLFQFGRPPFGDKLLGVHLVSHNSPTFAEPATV